MGLQKDLVKNVYGQEILLSNTYHKVAQIRGDKTRISFSVEIFNESKTTLIEEKNYSFIPNVSNESQNFIKQSYDYLKTLTEYEGAVDVLEDGQML